MKTICKYLLYACVPAIAACAGEETDECPCSGRPGTEDCVYVRADVSLEGVSVGGADTRSATEDPDGGYVSSSDGTEAGKTSENAVSEVLLVIAGQDNRNIAAALLEDAGSSMEYTIPVPFRYLKGYEGETVHVFVFCNPTDELKSLAVNTPYGELPADFADKIYTLGDPYDDPAWADGNFLMSNAVIYTAVLPEDWSDYRSVSSPYLLTGSGPLPVERSVARFDYKTVRDDNIYPVSWDQENPEDTKNPGIMVQLTDAAFVNISRNFYYLRRVADEGLKNIDLCGPETADNFIVDTDAEKKLDLSVWMNKSDYFYSNIEDPESWIWTSLSSLASAEEDNVWGGDEEYTKGYRIWRYMSENTAPTVASQVESISTGIVFKGRIVPGDGCEPEMAEVLEAGTEPVYLWNDVLYGTWEMTGRAGDSNEALRVAWYAVETNSESLEDAGFTEIAPSGGIYECRYYYMNRHNDNGIDDPEDENYLSPMKFAVVRNNVYKLSVNAVFGFGQGDIPQGETYLMMSVRVLPWVDRHFTITIDEKEQGNK